MPNPFIADDFLLQSPEARELYHGFAASLPIIDFHCHLSPGDIATDRRFETMTDIWIAGDHYKWRAMRACGVSEEFITGSAGAREKFDRWAWTVPRTLRNPLYHWTHMELANPFGMRDLLFGPETAESVWQEGNRLLREPAFSARGLLRHFDVQVVCTTDDPADGLDDHRAIAADGSFPVRVYPTFRPDKALAVHDPPAFCAWTERLGAKLNTDIRTGSALVGGLRARATAFHDVGCRLADHGLDEPYGEPCTEARFERVFAKAIAGEIPAPDDIAAFRSHMLFELAGIYHELGWTQQYHIGPVRNPNTALFERLGPDTGFDTMGDPPSAQALCRMLDRQERDGRLPRTILYTINPAANDAFAAVAGSFNDGSVAGRVQFGPAWWYNDQKSGMEEQLESLSRIGLLSQFVGMVTDSRSFLSCCRHDCFRRILCNMLGADMRNGLIPGDIELVGSLVRDVCHGNAERYFGFPDKEGTRR